MCLKLPPEYLNSGICPLYFTSIYTCKVTATPRLRGVNDCYLNACNQYKIIIIISLKINYYLYYYLRGFYNF